MTREARRAITRFEPDLIHVWTPRALPSRIALEARVATGADVIVNYEDPEHLHFEQAEGPFRSRDVLAPLEKANPTPDDIGRFLRDMPWDWVLGTLRDRSPRPSATGCSSGSGIRARPASPGSGSPGSICWRPASSDRRC